MNANDCPACDWGVALYDHHHIDAEDGPRATCCAHNHDGYVDRDGVLCGHREPCECTPIGDDPMTTTHDHGCPARVGDDCDERPAEVWCDRCYRPSTTVIATRDGDRTLCDEHARDLRYRLYAAAWR